MKDPNSEAFFRCAPKGSEDYHWFGFRVQRCDTPVFLAVYRRSIRAIKHCHEIVRADIVCFRVRNLHHVLGQPWVSRYLSLTRFRRHRGWHGLIFCIFRAVRLVGLTSVNARTTPPAPLPFVAEGNFRPEVYRGRTYCTSFAV